MEIKIEASCDIGKNMATKRQTGGDDDMVTCSLTAQGLRVTSDQMDELGGQPIGASANYYAEDGVPHEHTVQNFPKRCLLVTGSIEHRKESGKTIAKLQFTNPAIASGLRFRLDTERTALFAFALTWKAAGDEVEDVKALLKRKCYINLTIKSEPRTERLFSDSQSSPASDAAVGRGAKLDQKRRAAGEKEEESTATENVEVTIEVEPMMDKARAAVLSYEKGTIGISALQRILKIGYNRAARILEMLEQEALVGAAAGPGTVRKINKQKAGKAGGLASLEKEAREHAAKNPRRDPPRTPRKH